MLFKLIGNKNEPNQHKGMQATDKAENKEIACFFKRIYRIKAAAPPPNKAENNLLEIIAHLLYWLEITKF